MADINKLQETTTFISDDDLKDTFDDIEGLEGFIDLEENSVIDQGNQQLADNGSTSTANLINELGKDPTSVLSNSVIIDDNSKATKDLIEDVSVDLITIAMTKGLMPFPQTLGEGNIFGCYSEVMKKNRMTLAKNQGSIQALIMAFVDFHISRYEGYKLIEVKTATYHEQSICGVYKLAHPDLYAKLFTMLDQDGNIVKSRRTEAFTLTLQAIMRNMNKLVPKEDINFEAVNDEAMNKLLRFVHVLVTCAFVKPNVITAARSAAIPDAHSPLEILCAPWALAKATNNFVKKFATVEPCDFVTMLQHPKEYADIMRNKLLADARALDEKRKTSFYNGYKMRLDDTLWYTSDSGLKVMGELFVNPS